MIDEDTDLSKYDWDNIDFEKIPIDPSDPDKTYPFEPAGASTPAGGESIPMTTRTSLPQERGPRAEETSFGGELDRTMA